MSLLNKTKELFAFNNEKVTLGSFNTINSSMGIAYPLILSDKIINLILAKLTNPDLFNNARGLGLEEAMKNIFTKSSFKGYMYFQGKKLVAVTEGDILNKEFSASFTYKLIEVKSAGKIYSVILEQSKNISRILSNESSNIALASVIIYKMKEQRNRVSQDQASAVHKSSKNALEDSKETELLIIDSEDSIEMMSTKLSENNKYSLDFATECLVRVTGFPSSFFTGKFENGLGSTSANEKAMTESAIINIYSLYFKKFFMAVSDSIEIEKDLTLAISNAQGLIDLAQFDDEIDKEEIYRRIGIPKKNK